MGAPSFQSVESDLDRVPPFTAPRAPSLPLSNSRLIPGQPWRNHSTRMKVLSRRIFKDRTL
eukprot:4586146-Pyramimonas_sp.AAC.1